MEDAIVKWQRKKTKYEQQNRIKLATVATPLLS